MNGQPAGTLASAVAKTVIPIWVYAGSKLALGIVLPPAEFAALIEDDRLVMLVACVSSLPSAFVMRVFKALTALASALVATWLSALAAALAASVATLSVTATHAEPFQRFGVLALLVVSIHRFCVNRSATAGVVDWYNTLPLAPAASDAAWAACWAAVTFWLVVVRLLLRPVMA